MKKWKLLLILLVFIGVMVSVILYWRNLSGEQGLQDIGLLAYVSRDLASFADNSGFVVNILVINVSSINDTRYFGEYADTVLYVVFSKMVPMGFVNAGVGREGLFEYYIAGVSAGEQEFLRKTKPVVNNTYRIWLFKARFSRKILFGTDKTGRTFISFSIQGDYSNKTMVDLAESILDTMLFHNNSLTLEGDILKLYTMIPRNTTTVSMGLVINGSRIKIISFTHEPLVKLGIVKKEIIEYIITSRDIEEIAHGRSYELIESSGEYKLYRVVG